MHEMILRTTRMKQRYIIKEEKQTVNQEIDPTRYLAYIQGHSGPVSVVHMDTAYSYMNVLEYIVGFGRGRVQADHCQLWKIVNEGLLLL